MLYTLDFAKVKKKMEPVKKKMLAVVDFFLLFSLIPTFCQPQEIFFHWFLLLKLWIFFIPKKPKNFCIPREGTGIYSVPKVGLCCPSGNFLSWGATSQLKEPRRTKNFPRDNKAQPEGQNKSLYPPEGYKNYLVSEVWNNFKVLEAETSEKQFPAAEKKLELMKTAKTKSTKASIFVSSDPFSFSPSQSPESYFCSDFHVFRLAPFFYYRLIFLIFGLILRSTTTQIL